MEPALEAHRLNFAFTVTFHYLFPQLTMGLALLIVYLTTKALRTLQGESGDVCVRRGRQELVWGSGKRS